MKESMWCRSQAKTSVCYSWSQVVLPSWTHHYIQIDIHNSSNRGLGVPVLSGRGAKGGREVTPFHPMGRGLKVSCFIQCSGVRWYPCFNQREGRGMVVPLFHTMGDREVPLFDPQFVQQLRILEKFVSTTQARPAVCLRNGRTNQTRSQRVWRYLCGSSVLIRFLKTLIQTKVLGVAVDGCDCQVMTGADAISWLSVLKWQT